MNKILVASYLGEYPICGVQQFITSNNVKLKGEFYHVKGTEPSGWYFELPDRVGNLIESLEITDFDFVIERNEELAYDSLYHDEYWLVSVLIPDDNQAMMFKLAFEYIEKYC